MKDDFSPILIVGLGNPGKKYEGTRHNIGAYALNYYADVLGASFKNASKVDGYVASADVNGRKLLLLLPQTYMNVSGQSVKKCLEYYNISLENLIILSDDTYLPFGEVKWKNKGSAGGHNGLKDIEYSLGTNEYKRIKIGIGEKTTHDLADFVLQPFNKEEKEQLDQVSKKCMQLLEANFLEPEDQVSKKEDLRRN